MTGRMSGIEPQDQNSLRARVFNQILEDILEGRHKTGDPLVETKLAEELGVSRTPVREALRQLELEGLVSLIPNRGVIVAGVTESDVEDIYSIRSRLEGLAVRWAAERMSPEDLRQLEETAELMEYYTRRSDYRQLSRLDAKFHDLIYTAGRSKVMRHTLSTLMRYVQQARLGSYKMPDRAEKSLSEHKAILEALKDRDADKAEMLMTAHITGVMENLLMQRKLKQREQECQE